MGEINLKTYEFESFLLENVELFDEVLGELGEPPLLENKRFSPFSNFSITSHYLAVELNSSNVNTLPIVIWFEADSLRIDIEQMSESFDWSRKQIQETRQKVIDLIRNLFTGFVLIDSRRSSRFVEIFDSNGIFVQSFSYNNVFHMITGSYLFRYKNNHRLYMPNFPNAK